MASSAHTDWTGLRRLRLGELITAHSVAVRDNQSTEQILWSITVRLAAEFQGYARSLQTEAAEQIVIACVPSDPGLANILRDSFAAKRDLESGNARSESIANDFVRIGLLNIWNALKSVHGKRVDAWQLTLSQLNAARNAIAHDHQAKFAKLRSEGIIPVTLSRVTQWQQDLDTLVDAMDEVVSNYLAGLLQINPPW